MSGLVSALLTCAVVATTLACVAVLADRFSRRPALAHLLWLLVLVRLITPPLVDAPILPAWGSTAPPASSANGVELAAHLTGRPAEPATDAAASIAARSAAASPVQPSVRPWLLVAIAIWAVGAVFVGLVGLMRAVRFSASLRHARPADPSVQRQVRWIARRLGMRRAPPVVLLDAAIPPLVWAVFGRARVVLPAPLLSRLDRRELHGILAHECAHLRRRDPWTRLLEWVVTAAWWWFPLVWWARRRLRAAEEACCDAWALQVCRRDPDAYASGLLRTITWLVDTRARAPAVAVALGATHDLKRRIDMIVNESERRLPTVRFRWLLLCAGALLLVLRPIGAQEPTSSAGESADVRLKTVLKVNHRRIAAGTRAEIEQEIVALTVQIDELTARLHELKNQLSAARDGDNDAARGEAILRVRVMDEEGQPLAGIDVQALAESESGSRMRIDARTGADGLASLRALQGRYRILVGSRSDDAFEVYVDGGQRADIEVVALTHSDRRSNDR